MPQNYRRMLPLAKLRQLIPNSRLLNNTTQFQYKFLTSHNTKLLYYASLNRKTNKTHNIGNKIIKFAYNYKKVIVYCLE